MHYKTLKSLRLAFQARQQKKIKLMGWTILILCLIIVFVGLTGCTFNG